MAEERRGEVVVAGCWLLVAGLRIADCGLPVIRWGLQTFGPQEAPCSPYITEYPLLTEVLT